MSNRAKPPVRFVFRRVRLSVEELETRDLPSSTMPDTWIDPSQFASDHILVRWLNDSPVDTSLADGLEALGNNTYAVSLADGVSVQQAVEYYKGLGGVDFAQADYVIQTARTSNDPSSGSQWALSTIGAQTAWNYTTGSNTIIVAVVDTGVDYSHPDLAANIWMNTREIAGNGRDDDGNGFVDDARGYDFANNDADPRDDNGHGTHVAGIIGAVGNNGVGVSGVSWNVKIMPLKFIAANGSGLTSNAVKAVNYAVQMGAKIINNSWGGGGYDAALAAAIQNAQNRGVIFVAAAGNSAANNDATPQYPANYGNANVVSVAASDQSNRLATFSNFGPGTVDLAAPGVSILSTLNGNRYAYYSGTSMAAPYVSGAMALVWSLHPEWSYSQVISNVLNNVTRQASLTGKVASGGVLNVGQAVAAATPTPTPTPTPPSQPSNPAPSITGAAFFGGSNYFNRVRLTFANSISASTFGADDIVLTGPSGQRITPASISAVAGTNNTQFDVYFSTMTQIGNYSMSIGPDVRDTQTRSMDQNRNGVWGEAADRFTVTANLGGSASFSSGGVNKAIADLQTTTSTITIGQHITVGDLKVSMSIRHTYDSDLVIKLVSPTGKEIVLFNRRGGSGDNLMTTTFSDAAATSIANAAAPFNGTFRPEAALAAFKNQDAYGTWKLVITDSVRNDSGTLYNWSITVSSSTVATKADADDSSEMNADPIVPEKTVAVANNPSYSTHAETSREVVHSTTQRESRASGSIENQPSLNAPKRLTIEAVEATADADDQIENMLSAIFIKL